MHRDFDLVQKHESFWGIFARITRRLIETRTMVCERTGVYRGSPGVTMTSAMS